jgi:hypothetical protein
VTATVSAAKFADGTAEVHADLVAGPEQCSMNDVLLLDIAERSPVREPAWCGAGTCRDFGYVPP